MTIPPSLDAQAIARKHDRQARRAALAGSRVGPGVIAVGMAAR